MYAFQENKKQTEELNSSKIQETIVSYQKAMVQLKELYTEGLLSGFKFHMFCDQLHEATFALLANYSSFGDYMSSCPEFDDVNFSVQSGIDMDPTATEGSTQEQNVGFDTAGDNVIADIPHAMAYTKVDTSQSVELGDFLKRPVQIFTKSWTIGDTINQDEDSFNPWELFFSKTSISKKLDNYYMMRCNLHLKFVINASPFYYGCCLASYQPLTTFNTAPIVFSASNRLENVSLSQRPHIYLYPQDSQAGEMVLPFLYHKNWLDATSASDLSAMGTIGMNSFGVLMNANGVVGDNINIVCYAWAEDLDIAGPTIALSVQSDEYQSSGAISRPASAIARAAGHLSQVPVIGPFATATSYAAGAVADIASLFGYTNVPVIDDVRAFRNKPFPSFAATDIGTPIEKLTLDAKNELSVDPKICGVDVEDELTISSFVQRESFIHETTWASSNPINHGLFFAKVGPTMMRSEGTPGATLFYGTPMSHVASNFQYWRGDIIFRFKFICTKYHRGRVRINWDPHASIGIYGDYTTETYTKIVDIQETTDVEFQVPYTQLTSYLSTSDSVGETTAQNSTSTTGLNEFFNGTLTMRVLNDQSSPVSNADIKILTFIRGADNLEFAGPQDISTLRSPYAVQSLDVDTACDQLGVKPSQADPNINLVHMGESCVSLRQLMRRTVNYVRIINRATPGSGTVFEIIRNLPRSPMYPGYDPYGYNGATGLNSASSEPYSWVAWNAMTYYSQCFVGSRGSYIYNTNVRGLNLSSSVKLIRTQSPHTVSDWSTTVGSLPTNSAYEATFGSGDPSGMAGMAITNQSTQTGINALVPMYSRYKFLSNNILTRTGGTTADDSDTDAITLNTEIITNTSNDLNKFVADVYVGAGTDFSLVFFLNVPALWRYNSYPTPVAPP